MVRASPRPGARWITSNIPPASRQVQRDSLTPKLRRRHAPFIDYATRAYTTIASIHCEISARAARAFHNPAGVSRAVSRRSSTISAGFSVVKFSAPGANVTCVIPASPTDCLSTAAVLESLGDKVAKFNQNASKHMDSQSKNPFTSGLNLERPKFSKEEYGKPEAGSQSDIRGRKATCHVLKEILELCEIIYQNGTPCKDQPEITGITFGDLFNIYVAISDKCVGLLLRARRQKLVTFEGECLFQRRDDNVPIFLIKPIGEIRQNFKERIDELKKDIPLY